MPFYEYGCKACGHIFEEFHAISDSSIEVCPECGKKEVKRMISMTSKGQVEFKNSKELYETKIRPEAKKIAQKIREGDENAAADIFGEDKIIG